jgi:hypothetical protein
LFHPYFLLKADSLMTDSDSLMPDVTPEDMSLLNIHPNDTVEDEELARLLPMGEISSIQDNGDF